MSTRRQTKKQSPHQSENTELSCYYNLNDEKYKKKLKNRNTYQHIKNEKQYQTLLYMTFVKIIIFYHTKIKTI